MSLTACARICNQEKRTRMLWNHLALIRTSYASCNHDVPKRPVLLSCVAVMACVQISSLNSKARCHMPASAVNLCRWSVNTASAINCNSPIACPTERCPQGTKIVAGFVICVAWFLLSLRVHFTSRDVFPGQGVANRCIGGSIVRGGGGVSPLARLAATRLPSIKCY